MSGYRSVIRTPFSGSKGMVRKCFALSPTLLNTGSAYSDMDDASYDASLRFLCARYIFTYLTEACSVCQSGQIVQRLCRVQFRHVPFYAACYNRYPVDTEM